MGRASWKTSCTSSSLPFVSVKFHGLHFMFNTLQVAALSTLDGPSSPCHAPESALGYYTICIIQPFLFSLFSDLGLYIADIVTDLLNGVHWITKDDIIWGGITVSFFHI